MTKGRSNCPSGVPEGAERRMEDGDNISCQRTIRESQQTAAISLQASSECNERYKQCSNATLLYLSKQRGAQRRSVTNVTNVTHFRVRVSTFRKNILSSLSFLKILFLYFVILKILRTFAGGIVWKGKYSAKNTKIFSN